VEESLSARTTTLEKFLLLFYHPSHAHRGSILRLKVAIFFPENNTGWFVLLSE